MSHRRRLLPALCATLLAGGSAAAPVTYAPSDADFPNPERGFYEYTEWSSVPNLNNLYGQNVTLVHAYMIMPEFRGGPISAARLQVFRDALAACRARGLKAIIRVAYNSEIGEADAPLSVIETHLQQLAPIFAQNNDVIAFYQAGFIGSWGEWHSSTNNLTTIENREAVIDLLFTYLPANAFVQLRTPMFKWDYTGGAMLLPQEAFTDTPIARLAHHNDCYLASETDFGTYPPGQVELWKDRVAHDTQFVPLGGETCNPSDFTNCAFALPDMERLRYTYLNRDYNLDVLSELAPCMDTIRRRLGYRLELVDADLPDVLAPGAPVTVTINLRNVGFAPLYNERPVILRLSTGATIHQEVVLPADPRRWLPGPTRTITHSFNLAEALPAGGAVDISLWMPDRHATLRNDARYSVRFANIGTWDATRGHNVLAASVPVIPIQAPPAIEIDGAFGDWNGIAPLHVDPAGDAGAALADFTEILATNDSQNLYLRLKSATPYAFTSNHHGVFIDTDGDSATGYSFLGVGSEVLLQGRRLFDQRNGSFNAGELPVLLDLAPMTATTDVEIAIPLDARHGDGSLVFPRGFAPVRIALFSDTAGFSTQEVAPNGGGFIEVPLLPAPAPRPASWTLR